MLTNFNFRYFHLTTAHMLPNSPMWSTDCRKSISNVAATADPTCSDYITHC